MRLIIQYIIFGTYNQCELHTIPFIYESKEKAIEDFKRFLENHLEYKKKYYEKSSEIESRRNEISHKLEKIKCNLIDKSVEPLLLDKFSDLVREGRKHYESRVESFNFGNQILYYHHFYTKEEQIVMPNIMTVDEYFIIVEQ